MQAGATVRIEARPGTPRRGPFMVVWSEDRTVAQLVPLPMPAEAPTPRPDERRERLFRVLEVARR